MPEIRTGLMRIVDDEPKDDQERLQALVENLPEGQEIAGYEKRTTPDGDVYYIPKGLSKPEGPGEEIPIPEVSLPDVPKEPIEPPTALQPDEIPIPRTRPADAPSVKPQPRYDITPLRLYRKRRRSSLKSWRQTCQSRKLRQNLLPLRLHRSLSLQLRLKKRLRTSTKPIGMQAKPSSPFVKSSQSRWRQVLHYRG